MLIMQRLHEHDLTAHLRETDPDYKLIKLPMIAGKDKTWRISPKGEKLEVWKRKKGDLLHPERMGQKTVDKLSVNEYMFAGQYQQKPAPAGGGLVKRKWLKFYDTKLSDLKLERIIESWDTAEGIGVDSAYSACVRLGVNSDKEIFLLSVSRFKMEFPDLVDKVKSIFEEDKRSFNIDPELVIEDASSGTSLLPSLPREFNAIGVEPKKSKISRLIEITPEIKNGKIKFPSSSPYWWYDFEKELLTFPMSKFKDQVDALSQGVNYIRTAKERISVKRHGIGISFGRHKDALIMKNIGMPPPKPGPGFKFQGGIPVPVNAPPLDIFRQRTKLGS
jgi:predicted phage terminase large subunit-like protein